jgi:hypothetical protein
VYATFHGGKQILEPPKLGARRGFLLPREHRLESGFVERRLGALNTFPGRRRCSRCTSDFPGQDLGGIVQLSALGVERARALFELREFTNGRFTICNECPHAIARMPGQALRFLGAFSRDANGLACLGFSGRPGERVLLCRHEEPFQLGAFGDGRCEFAIEPVPGLVAFTAFVFSALAAFHGVAMTLAGYGNLGAQRLHGFSHDVRVSRDFVPVRIAGGPFAVRLIARQLCAPDLLLDDGQGGAEVTDLYLELREFVAPRRHVARSQRELDRKSTLHELGVPFGALALAGQRAHLALNFAEEVVESREILCRFVQAALGIATTIAIKADARGFLEQLAPVIRPV